MLALVAWRNVWRNKRRSLIMITAIVLGLWGGVFAVGIFTGMYDTMVSAAIDRDLTHIQLHVPGFREQRLIGMAIPHPEVISDSIRRIPGVRAVSPRTVIEGMGSSPTSSQGLNIVGVEPAAERNATAIARRMVEGSFFEGTERLPVVIGRKLAEKLSLKLRSKLVLSFQGPDGAIQYGAFRIAGIFDTESTVFDEGSVFVRRSDLGRLIDTMLVHEIAVRLNGNDSLETVRRMLVTRYPALRVETWKELAPELKLTETADVTMAIFLGIILLALVFGITNTMLMSVIDRVREFGVLMAVGMKRRRVFGMIVLETLFLAITGSVAGIVLGAVSVFWAGAAGINLSWFSDGLSLYGISSMLYPVVHAPTYGTLGVMVILASCAAAVYPALKAIRLRPASAIATFG
jgi:putative ABC transport system permease protein